LTRVKAGARDVGQNGAMKSGTAFSAGEAGVVALTGGAPAGAGEIVSRTLLRTAELRVVRFTLAEGQELTEHTSPRRAWVQVLEGSGDFFFNGRWVRLGAGDCLHLPPQHRHAVRAGGGAFSMLLILAAEPAAAGGET
jgi:quercetin dioxygenase-like cupin family protein